MCLLFHTKKDAIFRSNLSTQHTKTIQLTPLFFTIWDFAIWTEMRYFSFIYLSSIFNVALTLRLIKNNFSASAFKPVQFRADLVYISILYLPIKNWRAIVYYNELLLCSKNINKHDACLDSRRKWSISLIQREKVITTDIYWLCFVCYK